MSRVKKIIDPELFVRRFNEAMTRHGYTQEALAGAIEHHLGVRPGQSTISNWARGEKMPSNRFLPVLVELLDLSWHDLGFTSHPALPSTAGSDNGTPSPAPLARSVFIPHVGYASAGPGSTIGEPAADLLQAYPRDAIRRLTGANPDTLRALRVRGDSMEPELRPNDTVIFAPTHSVADSGLYILLFDDLVIVKKVQRFGGGGLELISTNPAYRNELLLPLPEADTPNTYRSDVTGLACTLEVVGKVVFYDKRW